MFSTLRGNLLFFARPVSILRSYKYEYLRPDIIAGLTVAVIALPQAMSLALIAELPPEVGLYAAVVGAIVGALWGSSSHLQTGPTNAASLLVLSVCLGVATSGSPDYMAAALVMTLLVGIIRLLLGLARLGVLVNFVSDSVIVGFTAGAGTLIFANQVRYLLRLPVSSTPSLVQTVVNIVTHLGDTHWQSLALGLGTLAFMSIVRRLNRKLPAPLLGMIAAASVVAVGRLDQLGVTVVGQLPRGLPPLSLPAVTNLELVGKLIPGAAAVALIGLVEAMSISRSIASQSGERLDSNQEFVGQGLANIACALLSGYTCSGSFARSAVNYEAGAQTALSSVFCGLFVLAAIVLLAPLSAYVPLAALAGLLTLIAYRLIDREEMSRIWRGSRDDRVIMIATLLATLALPLQFAVLTGIAVSLVFYLLRTSAPRVRTVLPEEDFRHFAPQPDRPVCPQMAIIEIMGDIYFGAVNEIEERIRANMRAHSEQRFLLLRMQTVERCDISGIHALENIVRAYRERHGDVYLVRVRQPVRELMESSGFYERLGADHFLDPDEAIGFMFYHSLDPAVCIYECSVRVFRECQNLPKHLYEGDVHLEGDLDLASVPGVDPRELWEEIRGDGQTLVIDVREPTEFRRAHVPGARSVPLPVLLEDADKIPRDAMVVLVCRGGRRSCRAAALLRERGYTRVRRLNSGMIAWEDANLLTAVSYQGDSDHD